MVTFLGGIGIGVGVGLANAFVMWFVVWLIESRRKLDQQMEHNGESVELMRERNNIDLQKVAVLECIADRMPIGGA